METAHRLRGNRMVRLALCGVEGLLVCFTLAALANVLLPLDFGLGLGSFFVGLVLAAWGAVMLPVCDCALTGRDRAPPAR